nr:zinc finger BED domain-containing protein DAYSLEEPER-like [Pseudochaenichthys georgianus]
MFLHPKLKSLKLLVEEHSMETVHNEVRRLVNDIKERRASPTQRVATVSSAPRPPPEKRARQSEGLSDVEDSSSSDECTEDEVSAYIDFKSPREENFDVLSWWKEHATRFPNVAHIARSILSIPASSAASERDFSTAGFVVSERRSQLKPATVDDILFLHSNLKKH